MAHGSGKSAHGCRRATLDRRVRVPPPLPAATKGDVEGAKGAHLTHHAGQFGTVAGPVETDMAAVRQRKRDMVNREVELHLQNYRTTGAELIMGSGRFVEPKVVEV